MPYLVLHGIRCRVITPQGRMVDPYLTRVDTTFTDDETTLRGLDLHFQRNGYRLIVPAGAAVRINLACADCGKTVRLPSLCETCARLRQGR